MGAAAARQTRPLTAAAAPAAVAPERCTWARTPLDIAYHDHEWGVPVHDDRLLFEMLILEGAQAGLSWSTILAKRDNYRHAFAGFDVARVARFGRVRIERLLGDAGIVRNRLKVESTVTNARAFLAIQREFGTFDAWLWHLAGGSSRHYRRRTPAAVPARSALSDRISRELSARGFRFVGSTIVYAYLQAVGIVNDHLLRCHRYAPIAGIVA